MEYYINNLGDGPSLYHHGVKGMKWGVRKKPVSSGVSKTKKATIAKPFSIIKKAAPTKPTPAVKKAFSGNKKDISKATDDELSAYLRRMQLEKQVLTMQKEMTELTASTASTAPPKKVSAGKRFVSAVWKDMLYPGVKDGMREVSRSVVKSLAEDMVKKAMEKKAAGS